MDKPHRKLEVWRLSMELTTQVYKLTSQFPSEEKFGLVSQMRRCAVSIPSNIAEGAARSSQADFARFLTIALGSLSELDTQLELASRLGYCGKDQYSKIDNTLASISRMLVALLSRMLVALRRSIQNK
jgi:four helix bundle protein